MGNGASRLDWRRRFALLAAVAVPAAGLVWYVAPWAPTIEVTDPGSTGRRVEEAGVFANYFPSRSEQPGAAVLLLGGSEGGIGQGLTDGARALQAEGFSVLTPGYFGVPGHAKTLQRVPLETFDRALRWLSSQPEVDRDRIAIAGVSKGAEAALLVAARHPELRAVIGGVPSSVSWPGISWRRPWPAPSWTSDGEDLAVLPYGRLRPSVLAGDLGRMYRDGLARVGDHPEAVIPVERIRAPMLLICGRSDSLWPSCPMASQVATRVNGAGVANVTVLAYSDAGHGVVGPPLDPKDDSYLELGRWGGTPSANNAARTDSWPKILTFLRDHTAD